MCAVQAGECGKKFPIQHLLVLPSQHIFILTPSFKDVMLHGGFVQLLSESVELDDLNLENKKKTGQSVISVC